MFFLNLRLAILRSLRSGLVEAEELEDLAEAEELEDLAEAEELEDLAELPLFTFLLYGQPF